MVTAHPFVINLQRVWILVLSISFPWIGGAKLFGCIHPPVIWISAASLFLAVVCAEILGERLEVLNEFWFPSEGKCPLCSKGHSRA